jgi:LacI family transcriptional regulator
MKLQITLQDIADRAGVSRTTVSLALRNHPGLPPVTLKRIQGIADDLGYRPNPLISTLMSYNRAAKSDRPKHLTLALLLKFSRCGAWQDYLSPEFIAGARHRAEQLGYCLEEFWLGDLKMDGSRLSQVLYHRSVPGIILAPLPRGADSLEMDWERFSAVAVGYSDIGPDLHRVTSDYYQAMLLAVEHLRRAQYRRLGLALKGNGDARVQHQWGAAFLWEQMRENPRDRVPLLLAQGGEWDEDRFGAWFLEHTPEAVLGQDPQILTWLERLGQRVPRDVGFVHLRNPDPSGEFAGPYYNPRAIGALAVDSLVAQIQQNDRGVPQLPRIVQLGASWIEGRTIQWRPNTVPFDPTLAREWLADTGWSEPEAESAPDRLCGLSNATAGSFAAQRV